MRTAICETYNIDVPIFGFSHSADVVAAVSRAGGFGVLGASGMEPEELDRTLKAIAQQCAGKPFGVDLIVPDNAEGDEAAEPNSEALQRQIPQSHRDFVAHLMDKYHVPEWTNPQGPTASSRAGMSVSPGRSAELIEVALAHPIKMLVNALGVPPAAVIERAHQRGVRVGALVGAVKHAQRQKAAGVDLIIAQGFEAGGHTGEITSMVLVPQVVDAVAPLPVLCAGGIASGRQLAAALALGAQGAWTGSVWLTTTEAEAPEVIKEKFLRATSSDTLRTRASTGKPARQLRSAWTDEWENPANPKPLPMPLQVLLTSDARQRIEHDAIQGGEGGKQLINYLVGQSVGMLNSIRPVAEVLHEMNDECDAVLRRLDGGHEPLTS